ncbi:hypothetical protein G7Z17_g9620 [Cylindrodendrum hubeiense]|uniref:Nephrocystin 3-like N-terminal domain-containing protein n=1 Tax=Cylindrodendrum hubeiense TaxID=595255 RepID=A0A9P5H7I5_9HYPO|nr:hypothetical protein G7Z17_g9620 [Cylindrodendrum hubeiense]
MNFAYIQAKKDEANTVVSFFFNARGDSLERSTIGMYRSLLYQLLGALPSLLGILDQPEHQDQLNSIHATILAQGRDPEWEVGILQDLLRTAITGLGQQHLTFFVDALDECNVDQVEELVDYFEDLGQCAVSNRIRFNICFSSRHYPHIDIQYGRKLILELQDGHENDITSYIRSKLKVGKGKSAEEIKGKMQIKAHGIFIWVVLVVNILNAEFKGGRIFDVKKRLDSIPTKLSDLFMEILSGDQQNLQDLRLCIQWVLFAKRPLTLEEYYFAVVSGLSPDELSEWDPEEVTRDDMKRFVLSSSKELAETTATKTPTVQFIHESVREFFLKDGVQELWPNLTGDFQSLSHAQLQKCCHSYIKIDISGYVPSDEPLPKAPSDAAKALRGLVSERFPFIEYATHHVLYHADAAAHRVTQDRFLNDFDLEAWINLQNLFEKYEIRRHTSTTTFMYIFAENNLTRLIQVAIRLGWRIHALGDRHKYPLFAALSNGHQAAVRALLQQDTSLAHENYIPAQLEYGKNFTSLKGQTPLQWAMQRGNMPLAERLLSTNEFDLNLTNQQGHTPLFLAAMNGHEAAVQLLIANGADLNARDNTGRTPLSLAVKFGHEAVLQLLLTKGADLNIRDISGQTPLFLAANNGHEATIQLLLAASADVNAQDNSSRSPLLMAIIDGHEAAV